MAWMELLIIATQSENIIETNIDWKQANINAEKNQNIFNQLLSNQNNQNKLVPFFCIFEISGHSFMPLLA